jgi:hypothetical protein
MVRAFADGNAETPIIPDEIAVSSSWKFIWTFDPSRVVGNDAA